MTLSRGPAAIGVLVLVASFAVAKEKSREHQLARTEIEAIRSLQARSVDIGRRERQLREDAAQLESDTAAVNSEIRAAHGVAPGAQIELTPNGILIEHDAR
jgi:hypothetical protein